MHSFSTHPSLGLPTPAMRSLRDLTEIYTELRILEAAHVLLPGPKDLHDYRSLMEDLTACLGTLLTELSGHGESDKQAINNGG